MVTSSRCHRERDKGSITCRRLTACERSDGTLLATKTRVLTATSHMHTIKEEAGQLGHWRTAGRRSHFVAQARLRPDNRTTSAPRSYLHASPGERLKVRSITPRHRSCTHQKGTGGRSSSSPSGTSLCSSALLPQEQGLPGDLSADEHNLSARWRNESFGLGQETSSMMPSRSEASARPRDGLGAPTMTTTMTTRLR